LSKALLALVALAATTAPAAAQNRAADPPPIPRATFLANMDTEFRKMDADRNGMLSRKEIEDYQTAQGLLQLQARNRQLFAALDTDRNGVLSPAEFARLPTMLPSVPPPNPEAMLQRFDTNRDRQISLVEYRAGTLANFDRLDADKDGVVTAAEMKAAGLAPQ